MDLNKKMVRARTRFGQRCELFDLLVPGNPLSIEQTWRLSHARRS